MPSSSALCDFLSRSNVSAADRWVMASITAVLMRRQKCDTFSKMGWGLQGM
ncbi:hypothetical protein [Azorhizobium sp. AG788]|uniref:hypothetical protein n=1 Tax=Azorhizobium sp. AG788 TaxID=2183897 RepID=UPI0031391F3A